MPTGFASTRILVGLLVEKYGIAVASGRTVLTFSKDSACGLPMSTASDFLLVDAGARLWLRSLG